ncbi:ErmE/ErmH/ErmO/ErmR family 23S rRNA (adenine(2058)-N(6))-methyltransferase [Streptomyces sp. NPDC088116]|uniref:ErmE/ErmH/ErmO/ErmR family 23S rRNA (adenine(2058)-N(6))-methyltransferase n=1 Tax=Streptomyces sp. NPDC088116 TaxID=3365825 RepID=UPI0038141BDE
MANKGRYSGRPGETHPPGTGRRPPAQRGPQSGADVRRRIYGQNFLVDHETVRCFARFADPHPDETLLEVGAGRGGITREVARLCKRVVAYEIDQRIAGELKTATAQDPKITVVTGDFLKARKPDEDFSVVGNIPFGNTSEIIDWYLDTRQPRTATLITQLEYARKRTGGYGRWSKLTVASWPEVTWRMGERISRHKFRPVPAVDSAMLRLERRPVPLLSRDRMREFRDIVDIGFTGKGGSLDASLRRHFPVRQVNAAFRTARLDRGVVVAFVSPDQWITLYDELLGR